MRLVLHIPRRKPEVAWSPGFVVACTQDQAERTFQLALAWVNAGTKGMPPG